ncbi:helix-turn-helix domain-containing protein [Methylobacter sp.]|uniref:helix-turn-helix domain-containing protein n=1 Tax=Methylobacter sp. TaxID=2051955 RepID=UPI002FDD5FB8
MSKPPEHAKELVKTFGMRMRAARELCGLSQIEAAKRLGYANSTKLTKIELASDTNSIPFWVISMAAKTYQVSTDYLLGLTDEWQCNHSEALQSKIEKTVRQSQSIQYNPIRQLYEHISAIESAVSINLQKTAEFKDLVTRFRSLNPSFDTELRLGAKLLRMANETNQEAANIAQQLAKSRDSIKSVINI